MRQYHRTKVSVRANGIPWFSDASKRSMIPRGVPLFAGRSDEPKFHLNDWSAGQCIGVWRVRWQAPADFPKSAKVPGEHCVAPDPL